MQRRLAREAAPTPAQLALKELAAKRAARDVVRVGEDELEDVLDDDIDDTASLDQEESSSASDSDTGACRKPAGRLQRLDAASMLKKAVSSASDLQQLINGVSSLGIGKAVQTPQQHLPMNVLHVAATCQLPSDSDSSIDSDSSSGNEAGRGNRGDNDTTGRAASPDGSSSSSTWKPSAIATGTQGTVNRSADDLVLGEKHEYHLPAALYKKLYAHQVEGVRWLWSLHTMQRGGILGDDMGLGKTMQCSAFLTGLLGSRLVKRALIIAPKTLLLHWEKELGVCGLGPRTHMFGDSASERAASLRTTMGPGGGVLLTTYGMVLHNAAQLASPQSQRAPGAGEWAWDYMILDEGHKVKNPKMKLVQELHRVPAKVKVIISGTPIQNNLAEMHSLMEFCCEGLLGDVRTFKRVYEKPITSGQDRDATPRQREVGAAVAAELRRVLAPYFLRREKASVMCGKTTEASTSQPHASADSLSDNPGSNSTQTTDSTQQQRQHQQQSAAPPTLGRKNDLVVWLRMRPLQQAVYRAFLESEPVKRALNETDSPLAALTVLKKVCDHPALLSEGAAGAVISGSHKHRNSERDFIVHSDEEEEEEEEEGEEEKSEDSIEALDSDSGSPCSSSNKPTAQGRQHPHGRALATAAKGRNGNGCKAAGPDMEAAAAESARDMLAGLNANVEAQLMKEMRSKGAAASCKTLFVLALLDRLVAEGHRTLIFSQSRVMLDILQAGIQARSMSFCRIDGTVLRPEERQAAVQRFQEPGSTIPVFLLTSQVGGLGLTLTAANRVVIVDPSWNPSVDNQAVDRAYRIGQTRNVVVYRLITCGTVEEKIYRKQVFKGGLSRAGTEEGAQFRYFTQQQLRDLFQVTSEGLLASDTQRLLHQHHAAQRLSDPDLDQHLHFLTSLEGYTGVSDHDLLFSNKPQDVELLSQAANRQIVSQLEAAAAARGTGTGSGSTNNSGARKAAAPGQSWKGSDQELSAMFNSALSLGPSAVSTQRRRVDALAQRLASSQQTAAALGKTMADGGRKMRERCQELEAELSIEQAKLLELEAEAGSSSQPSEGSAQCHVQQASSADSPHCNSTSVDADRSANALRKEPAVHVSAASDNSTAPQPSSSASSTSSAGLHLKFGRGKLARDPATRHEQPASPSASKPIELTSPETNSFMTAESSSSTESSPGDSPVSSLRGPLRGEVIDLTDD